MIKETWKKMIGILAISLVTACGFAFSADASAVEVKGKLIEEALDAEEFLQEFLGDDPASMDGEWQLTDMMDAAMKQMGGFEGMAKSLANLGAVKEIGHASEAEQGNNKIYPIPCVFENMNLNLVVSVQAGKLAGLTTAPYTGEEETEAVTEQAKGFTSVDLAIPVPELDGELPGTLTLPEGDGPFPAVILVHGSGPNDRDETLMKMKPFKDIADGLTEKGIAVYRYDKRTLVYGSQIAEDTSATLEEETIKDAVAAVQLLAEQEKIDPEHIYVLGHSLGGLAIPAINQELVKEEVKAAGYILLAAPVRRLDEIMREQYDYLYSLMPEVTEEQQEAKDELFAELDKLKDPDSLADDETVAGAYGHYWKWLIDYDVLATAEEIDVPCLLLQGEEDYQVTDYPLWEEAFGEKENWQMKLYPGLVHTFTPGKKSEGNTVYSKEEHVDPEAIDDIATFVLEK